MAVVVATAEELIEAAVADTGCSDFDGDEWREGLDRLLHALEVEANLHELGHEIANAQIKGSLCTRLRIIDWHRSHPEVGAATVPAPVVILGQPRTGTTILFDLMAQDPGFRVAETWEVREPVPPPTTEGYEHDVRIDASQAEIDLSEHVLPGFQAIHPTGARRGQECVAITSGDFRSMLWSTVYDIPSYTDWLFIQADMSSAYRYHRKFLQVLQSECPGERWLLKSPAHQWHLANMLATYPDATIVHTHRDPLRVAASVASLTDVLQRLGTDESSIPALAPRWFDYLIEGSRRMMDARADGLVDDQQVIDIAFGDIVTDAIGVVERIYDRLDRPLTANLTRAMSAFLADNPSDKHGVHRYSFADTHMDVGACRERAAEYQAFFDVPSEVA